MSKDIRNFFKSSELTSAAEQNRKRSRSSPEEMSQKRHQADMERTPSGKATQNVTCLTLEELMDMFGRLLDSKGYRTKLQNIDTKLEKILEGNRNLKEEINRLKITDLEKENKIKYLENLIRRKKLIFRYS